MKYGAVSKRTDLRFCFVGTTAFGRPRAHSAPLQTVGAYFMLTDFVLNVVLIQPHRLFYDK